MLCYACFLCFYSPIWTQKTPSLILVHIFLHLLLLLKKKFYACPLLCFYSPIWTPKTVNDFFLYHIAYASFNYVSS